ncbi:hypothetical protein BLOT_009827 [Blomia tropicalis]|nr:hypothetical protein BLOT_009827 [Blomia tropicalis]
MEKNQHEFTKSGKMKPPPLEEILSWIEKSWTAISNELIKKSFIVCGIANNVDGSEDGEIHCLKESQMQNGIQMLKEGLNNPDSNIDLNHLDYNSDEEDFIEFLRELEHDTSSESE